MTSPVVVPAPAVVVTATGPLDRIPAWARHLILAVFGPAVLYVGQQVIDNKGVTGLPYASIAQHALNVSAVAAVLWLVTLVGTPLTRQYGVGAQG